MTKKGNTIWIIVGIIAVVVVVVVIASIAFIALRKRNLAPTRKQTVWQSVVQKLVRVWSQRVYLMAKLVLR
jgi:F0F1-type ATP synthase membrane subunit a